MDLVELQTLHPHGLLQRPAIPKHHHGDPADGAPGPRPAELDRGQQHDERGDGGDRGERSRQRLVFLRHALLDEVAHRDHQDELERGELRELLLPHAPRHQEEEEERHGGPEDDLHQGITRVM